MKSSKIEKLEELDSFITHLLSIPYPYKENHNYHEEGYCFAKFLQTFGAKILAELQLPFEIVHSDKPDYRILGSTKKIGIEITQSISEQLARAEALCEKEYRDGWLEPCFFEGKISKLNNDEILSILNKSQKKLHGAGYTGKEVEENWINGIIACVETKTKKLNKKDFKKFSENILLINDKQTRIFLDIKYVLEKLIILMTQYYNNNNYVTKFDRIYVMAGENFFYLTQQEQEYIPSTKNTK